MWRCALHLDALAPKPAQKFQRRGVGRAQLGEIETRSPRIVSHELLELPDLVGGQSALQADPAYRPILGHGEANRHAEPACEPRASFDERHKALRCRGLRASQPARRGIFTRGGARPIAILRTKRRFAIAFGAWKPPTPSGGSSPTSRRVFPASPPSGSMARSTARSKG